MGICGSSPEEEGSWKPYDQQPEDALKPYTRPTAPTQKAEDEDNKQAPVPGEMIQVQWLGYFTPPPDDTEDDLLTEPLGKNCRFSSNEGQWRLLRIYRRRLLGVFRLLDYVRRCDS